MSFVSSELRPALLKNLGVVFSWWKGTASRRGCSRNTIKHATRLKPLRFFCERSGCLCCRFALQCTWKGSIRYEVFTKGSKKRQQKGSDVNRTFILMTSAKAFNCFNTTTTKKDKQRFGNRQAKVGTGWQAHGLNTHQTLNSSKG